MKSEAYGEEQSDSEDPVLTQLTSSLEFTQLQAYLANDKFEKADRMLASLLELDAYFDPQIRVYLLKLRYQVQLSLNPKQAEMTLMNMLQTIRETTDDLVLSFTPDDVVGAEIDLLLHYTNHIDTLTSPTKLLEQASHVLSLSNQSDLSAQKRSLAHFIVALARLESEQVPYQQVKNLLKVLVLELSSISPQDLGLLKMALHNLAALNYIQILETQERGPQSQEDRKKLDQMNEQVSQLEALKRDEKLKQAKINEEVEIQRREKQFQERVQEINKQARMKLAELSKQGTGDPDSKLHRARIKKNQLLHRQAQRLNKRQLMSDPYFRKILKRNTSNSAESVRDRSQRTALNQKVIDLLEGSSIGAVKSVVNYEQPDFQLRQRSGNQLLPTQTLDAFYETMVLGRLKTLSPIKDQLEYQLNEVLPLLYASLKVHLENSDEKSKLEIRKLDDFIKHDPQHEVLDVSCFETVSLIARIYTAESLKNRQRSDYWLSYMQSLAMDLPDNLLDSGLKRAQSLRCAFMIDQGQAEEAKEILEGFVNDDFTQAQSDIQILTLTLSGIINSNDDHLAKAEHLTSELKSSWSERRQWLILPKITI